MDPYAPYPLNLVRDWFYRRRWWVRLALAVVLMPWFGHFAYTRWMGEPAKPFDPTGMAATTWDAALTLPAPAVDRTRDMVAAIRSLPALLTVSVPTTTPAGMTWVPASDQARRLSPQASATGGRPASPRAAPLPVPSLTVDPDCARYGEWKPQERYHLQQIINYLQQPAISSALESISGLAGQPYCLSHSRSGMGGPAGGALGSVRQTAKILATRARYWLAHKHDFQAALRDVETVLQLADDTKRDRVFISTLTGLAVRGLALWELGVWGREFELSGDQRRQITEMIDRHKIEAAIVTRACMEAELMLVRSNVDGIYTDDGQGNGWMVLGGGGKYDFLRCENLFSPLFDSRAEALRHIDRYGKHARKLLSEHAGVMHERQAGARWQPPPTSPWLYFDTVLYTARLSNTLERLAAQEEAVAVILAVEAFRWKHGQYPERLADLVPEFLASLPVDPASKSAEPLRYRLDEKDGYIVYSVGWNGTDDGGSGADRGYDAPDWVFRSRRANLENATEWILTPAKILPQPQPGNESAPAMEEPQ